LRAGHCRTVGLINDAVTGAMVLGALFHQPFQPAFQSQELRRVMTAWGWLQVAGTEILAEQIAFETDALASVRPHDG
jgi:hypothetical protein